MLNAARTVGAAAICKALCKAIDVMAIVFNWMLQVDLLVWRQTIDCKADTTWKTFWDQKRDVSNACFGAQVSSKYGTWYSEPVMLAFWLALHIFATQRWRAPRRAKQLSAVAILLYRFLSCWCLEMFFSRIISIAVYRLSLYIFFFFGWSDLL